MSTAAVRAFTLPDLGEVLDVVVESGMFEPGDTGVVEHLLSHRQDDDGEDDPVCLVASTDRIVGVAVAELRPATAGLWELTMIGVRPVAQGSGVGTALLRTIEGVAQGRGARAMVVETSDLSDFIAARAFYRQRGYEQVGAVSDWWDDGDGLVLFRRRFTDA